MIGKEKEIQADAISVPEVVIEATYDRTNLSIRGKG